MKKLVLFLCVIAGVYGSVGNALVEGGTAAINSTNERMLKAGI